MRVEAGGSPTNSFGKVATRCGVAQFGAAVLGLDGNPDAGRARYGEAARFAVAGPFGGAVNSVGELILGRLR